MTDRDRETHENEERTVVCPVEGCDAEPLARALHLHVMQSADEAHGERGEIPEDVDLEAAKDAGTRTVEMEYPTEREQDKEPRLCPYCGETFAGGQAIMIHLGQVAEREDHPDDAARRHDPEDFPRVEEMEEEGGPRLIEMEHKEAEGDPYIPAERVYHYIGKLLEEGDNRAAQRARRYLLREPVSATTERLLEEIRDATHENSLSISLDADEEREGPVGERPGMGIASALADEGVYLRCRGEEEMLSPDEARRLADEIEEALTYEDLDGVLADLADWLRDASEVYTSKESQLLRQSLAENHLRQS